MHNIPDRFFNLDLSIENNIKKFKKKGEKAC